MFFYRSWTRGIIIFKALNMINDLSIELQPLKRKRKLLKVLTHPARLAILNILRDANIASAIWKRIWVTGKRISPNSGRATRSRIDPGSPRWVEHLLPGD